MENKIRFGPAGNSSIFYESGYKHSVDAPRFCKENGLSAYEYSFGRGFTMSSETASQLGSEACKYDILISLHAPYYINLANESDEMAEKSFAYITKGFEYLKLVNGRDYVVHLGSCGKLDRQAALDLTSKRLDTVLGLLYDNNYDSFKLCPETMGKYLQIGSYKEIIDYCKRDKMLIPTFDFGHINCVMQGALKTVDDYKRIIDYGIDNLGSEKMNNCHIHFSKIEYSDKGEIKHLTLDDNVYGPDFEPLVHVLKEYKMTPTIISESKERMMEDAMLLRDMYENTKI